MKLRAFPYGAVTPELRPARARRRWMDAFPDRHAYRCLPLSIANSFGWELLSPCDLLVEFNGGGRASDILISAEDDFPYVGHFAASNFTAGILTLHTGYIFRTEPGWSLLATGPVNDPKPDMAPLTGLTETDWLPYPFTMNYQLMRAGTFRFRKGEPFCHVVPMLTEPVEEAEVEILPIADEAGLKERMDGFAARRGTLLKAGVAPGPDTVREAWGREYFRGRLADGTSGPRHTHKLRLSEPIDRRAPPEDPDAAKGYVRSPLRHVAGSFVAGPAGGGAGDEGEG
ncbi:MAG TPA: DUF6065 family protein [Allosphingosinicella sp.]